MILRMRPASLMFRVFLWTWEWYRVEGCGESSEVPLNWESWKFCYGKNFWVLRDREALVGFPKNNPNPRRNRWGFFVTLTNIIDNYFAQDVYLLGQHL